MWAIFGTIENPLPKIGPGYGGLGAGGLGAFLNNIVKLLIMIGGLWAFFNFILAGYEYMNAAEDPKRIAGAWGKIWLSMVGLLIIVSSFVIAAVAGQLLFGDPKAILFPKVYGP